MELVAETSLPIDKVLELKQSVACFVHIMKLNDCFHSSTVVDNVFS